MKSVATIKLKICKTKPLLDTMSQYSKAVSYIADQGYKSGIDNRYKLQSLLYYKARKKFNLPAQFVINACRVASQTLKSAKASQGSKPVFKRCLPVDFDRRTFTFSFDKVRLTTVNGRIDVPIEVPEYYWKYLDWNYKTALLILDKKGRMFLHITFSRDISVNKISNGLHVGVDVGVNNLAVTSDGRVFRAPKTRIMQFRYLRNKLQRKGTKSSKRLLKKHSGKWKRYMRWVNHNVSKQIVNDSDADIVALENIKGIRTGKNRFRGYFNKWLHSWSFCQLQQFIVYKAAIAGKRAVFVNPYMTSQTCSNCLEVGSRYSNSFVCLHCGFECDSDLNASFNLRRLSVTQPHSSGIEVKGQLAAEAELRAKSPRL